MQAALKCHVFFFSFFQAMANLLQFLHGAFVEMILGDSELNLNLEHRTLVSRLESSQTGT